MTMMSDSDAKAYCLAIAQLIPVFLIALYVIDNNWLKRIIENERKRLQRPKKPESLAQALRDSGENALSQQIEKINNDIAKLDRANPARMNREINKKRQELIAARGAIERTGEKFLDKAIPSLDNIFDQRDEKIEEVFSGFDSKMNKLIGNYTQRAVLAIPLGITTEAIVLLGAIGLINTLVAMACGTSVIILIAGTLSTYTLDRLTWESKSKISRLVNKYLLVTIIVLATGIFVWICVSVSIVPNNRVG